MSLAILNGQNRKGYHMSRHGLERILLRNQFYWENYRLLALACFLLLLVILSLMGVVYYQRVIWPKPQYFATTPSGMPIPIVRLDEPYYTDPTVVMEWAKNAVMNIYAIDYVTWRQTLQGIETYFTPKGYQDFLVALKASTNLEAIKTKRQVVSVSITGAPQITRSGQTTPSLPYSWDIQMPVTVTYQNSTDEIIKQNATVLMLVERGSLLRYKDGVAIEQLVLQAS